MEEQNFKHTITLTNILDKVLKNKDKKAYLNRILKEMSIKLTDKFKFEIKCSFQTNGYYNSENLNVGISFNREQSKNIGDLLDNKNEILDYTINLLEEYENDLILINTKPTTLQELNIMFVFLENSEKLLDEQIIFLLNKHKDKDGIFKLEQEFTVNFEDEQIISEIWVNIFKDDSDSKPITFKLLDAMDDVGFTYLNKMSMKTKIEVLTSMLKQIEVNN